MAAAGEHRLGMERNTAKLLIVEFERVARLRDVPVLLRIGIHWRDPALTDAYHAFPPICHASICVHNPLYGNKRFDGLDSNKDAAPRYA